MDGNLTQPLLTDTQEMRNAVMQVMADAIKNLPRPQMPSWMQALADHVKLHPLTSFLIFLLFLIVLFLIIREVVCSYLKTNEILERLKRLEEKLTQDQDSP